MKPGSSHWSITGVAAGALCLVLVAAPALADPVDDENESGKVRIYSEDPQPLQPGEVRIYRDEGGTPPPAPDMSKEIKLGAKDDARADSEDAQIPGGYLGVRVQDITRELQKAKDLPRPEGALINRVEVDSPAYEAGIRRGDVIVELDGQKIGESSDLISRVRDLKPGTDVRVVAYRSGQRKSFTVTVGKRPKESMMMSPRAYRWMDRYGDIPDMPPMGEQLDRIRLYRQDIQKQLNDIQEQLIQLREGDLQRLEDEIRALREELKAREENREPQTN